MEFSLATNFDDGLIEQVRPYPVTEIFGKLSKDVAGGGRASYQIVGIGRSRLARHVRKARAAGIRFNYLLNAACMDNREFTRSGQRALRSLLDWIAEIGVEAVTLSSPFLLRIVKDCYPKLRVRVSVFACVDHVRKAQMWEELGADCIMLDSLLVNREFELLGRIREALGCELQIMVNNQCLQSCAYAHSHMTALAHASQSGHHTGGFLIDWCFLRCTMMRLLDPVHYLRSEWIRPEDLHHYEALGYGSFKITERAAPTAVLVRRVQAYSRRSYQGNLLDLVQPFGFQKSMVNEESGFAGLLWRLRHLFRPSKVNPLRLRNLARLTGERGMTQASEGPPPVMIDNAALDGFIQRFLQQGCRDVDCEKCRYCHIWADKTVQIDRDHRERCLALYDALFEDLHSGRMWGVGNGRSGLRPEACRSE